jgi:hypothetical protein
LQSKSSHHPRRRYRSAANQDTPEIEASAAVHVTGSITRNEKHRHGCRRD